MKTITLIASIIFANLLCGCGTILSLEIGDGSGCSGHGSNFSPVYGGVKFDAGVIHDQTVGPDNNFGGNDWLIVPFVAIDMIPSAIADTLLLPYT